MAKPKNLRLSASLVDYFRSPNQSDVANAIVVLNHIINYIFQTSGNSAIKFQWSFQFLLRVLKSKIISNFISRASYAAYMNKLGSAKSRSDLIQPHWQCSKNGVSSSI